MASPVRNLLARSPVVGFAGSRRAGVASLAALGAVLPLLGCPAASVYVGCAPGADAFVRRRLPGCTVLRASAYGTGPGAPAARSTALVRAVSARGSCLVAVPDRACPLQLAPSPHARRCFGGYGSGTWAALALAAGLGVPALLFLPRPVSTPAGWGWQHLGTWGAGAWWHRPGTAAGSQVHLWL